MFFKGKSSSCKPIKQFCRRFLGFAATMCVGVQRSTDPVMSKHFLNILRRCSALKKISSKETLSLSRYAQQTSVSSSGFSHLLLIHFRVSDLKEFLQFPKRIHISHIRSATVIQLIFLVIGIVILIS